MHQHRSTAANTILEHLQHAAVVGDDLMFVHPPILSTQGAQVNPTDRPSNGPENRSHKPHLLRPGPTTRPGRKISAEVTAIGHAGGRLPARGE